MNSTIKERQSNNLKYLITILILVLVLLIGGSYAWLQMTINSKKTNTVVAGKLELTLNEVSDAITIENAVPMTDHTGNNTRGYTFSLKNKGNISSDYIIYLDDVAISENANRMDDRYVKYSLTKNGGITQIKLLSEAGVNPNRIIDSGTISAGGINTYTLKLWIDSAATNEVMETQLATNIRIEAIQSIPNDNIVAAYEFVPENNVRHCVTGEEPTCAKTNCYEPKDANSCSPGVIVKYKVNNNTEKYFYVLHDDGVTMTLQQRENTISNIAWNVEGVTTAGPNLVLSTLDNATSSWSNVNQQEYKLGETIFNKNAFTGCTSYDDCNYMSYQLDPIRSNARLITVQEALSIGCSNIHGSCPMWMNNYISNCNANYCNTIDPNPNNNGYWTMSSFVNATNNYSSWNINNNGSLEYHNVSTSDYGARAVIVINK